MPFFGGGGASAGIGGSTGATDNSILRADGTGGATLQNSALVVDDAVVAYACTGVAATDIITAVGHNFTNNQGVRFTSLTGGSGLNTTTDYFVRNPSGNTFQVSTSSGGAAVNFTTDITAGVIVAHNENVTMTNQSSDTNSSVVITPKGTGAFIVGPKPDGTSVGGTRRGNNAADFQVIRSISSRVASGARSFLGGCDDSLASGSLSAVLGGTVNAATNSNAVVVGSNNSTASGPSSVVIAGNSATVSVHEGVAIGAHAVSDRRGTVAIGGGLFSSNGDRQKILAAPVSNKTSSSVAVELFLLGTTDIRFAVPSGKTMACIANIAATTSGGEFANMYVRQFIIANRGGTTALRGTVQTIGTDIEGIAGADVSITANDTNDAIKIDFTGVAPVTGCTALASTDVISKTAHGYADNDDIVFTSLTGGAGLTANTVTYWVRDATADTFKVSATRGGTAVNITTDYSDMTAARLFRVVASVDAVEIGHGT